MQKFVEGILESKYFWITVLLVGCFVVLFPEGAKLFFRELDRDFAHTLGAFWLKYGYLALGFVVLVGWIASLLGDEKKGEKKK